MAIKWIIVGPDHKIYLQIEDLITELKKHITKEHMVKEFWIKIKPNQFDIYIDTEFSEPQ